MLVSFVRDVIESVNPMNYSRLCLFPVSRGVSFFSKLLFFSYILFILLMIPTFSELPEKFAEEAKHLKFNVEGNFTSDKEIMIPESKAFFVIDTNATKLTKGSRFTLTEDSIFYKPSWSVTQKITYKEMGKPGENEEKIASLFSFLATLLAPVIVLTVYFWFWLKYFLFAFVLGTIAYSILDLTAYSMPYSKVLTTAYFCLIWIVPAELISTAFSTDFLLKFITISGIPFYSVTTLIYSTLFIASLVFAVVENKKKVIVEWNGYKNS